GGCIDHSVQAFTSDEQALDFSILQNMCTPQCSLFQEQSIRTDAIHVKGVWPSPWGYVVVINSTTDMATRIRNFDAMFAHISSSLEGVENPQCLEEAGDVWHR